MKVLKGDDGEDSDDLEVDDLDVCTICLTNPSDVSFVCVCMAQHDMTWHGTIWHDKLRRNLWCFWCDG